MCCSSHVKDRGGRAEVSSLPTMQVLGFKLESLGSIVSTFSHRVIRPALMWHFICASPHVAFYLCISEVSSTNGMAVIFTLRHRDVKKLGHSHRVSYDATANVTKFQITSALLQRTGTWVDGVAERYNSPRMYKAPGSVPAIAN